jgi:hypothetical protein
MYSSTLNTCCTSICGYIGFCCAKLVQLSKLLVVMNHSCRMFGAQLFFQVHIQLQIFYTNHKKPLSVIIRRGTGYIQRPPYHKRFIGEF